jgi:hypothetical protein
MPVNALAPEPRNAMLRPYEPSWKEQIAAYLMGDTRPSPERRQFATGIADILGYLPGTGNVLQGQEAARAGDTKGAIMAMLPLPGANVAARAEQKAVSEALMRARLHNTFTGQTSSAGRGTGFTQPKGTPVEKLFSNFADEKMSPQMQETFRGKMFDRANKEVSSFKDTILSDAFPINEEFTVKLDSSPLKQTRVQLLKDGDVVTAAQLEKGLLDSIATKKEHAGNRYGAFLLDWIDRAGVGNIYEVPDRSPGFVKIQKDVIRSRQGE